MESYSVYTRLPSADSIRILSLQPDVESAPLACLLHVIEDRNQAPGYSALSYCWGDATDRLPILCNGMSVLITKSLHTALCRFRRDKVSRLIWADAICINQADNSERQQQVSIMREVYACAARVFVWTGPSDKYTFSTFRTIRAIAKGCLQELYGSEDPQDVWLINLHHEVDRSQLARKLNFHNRNLVNSTKVWEFYSSDWFSRVWVIQEVQSCTEIYVLCGDATIRWEYVALAALWVCQSYAHDPALLMRIFHFPEFGGVRNASFMWNRSLKTRREAPFLALLDLVRHFQATDPRDKVFALLQYPVILVTASAKSQESQDMESAGQLDTVGQRTPEHIPNSAHPNLSLKLPTFDSKQTTLCPRMTYSVKLRLMP